EVSAVVTAKLAAGKADYPFSFLPNDLAAARARRGKVYQANSTAARVERSEQPTEEVERSEPAVERGETTVVEVSPRVGTLLGEDTAADCWGNALVQIKLQLDPTTFSQTLHDARLVDFEPESTTFVVAVKTPRARDL